MCFICIVRLALVLGGCPEQIKELDKGHATGYDSDDNVTKVNTVTKVDNVGQVVPCQVRNPRGNLVLVRERLDTFQMMLLLPKGPFPLRKISSENDDCFSSVFGRGDDDAGGGGVLCPGGLQGDQAHVPQVPLDGQGAGGDLVEVSRRHLSRFCKS